MFKHYIYLILVGFFCCQIHAIEPKEILARADAARGNLDGVRWTVEITDADEATRKIEVRARGFDMRAETLAPSRQKGHTLLLSKGNMWFYKPGLSKAVPVSTRQKLAGKAANGDIASTNYAEDYEVLSMQEGMLDSEPCYLFELQAESRNVTYARIKYWISKERLVGLRAEYYNPDGSKQLKHANMSYAHSILKQGEDIPFISRISISDAIGDTTKTIMKFSPPELGPVPNRLFSPQSLAR
ncbi:outer membrane lipoprotein-sorting protein [Coraliomargarita sinensis]|nr:outer membrane lipoprotein-sorting protein [Coraliomargarita sinensis]